MHRFILFAFLLVCVVCVCKATPVPQENNESGTDLSDMEKVQKALQDTFSNIEKQAKELMENINFKETLDKVGQAVQDAAAKVREGTEKLVS